MNFAQFNGHGPSANALPTIHQFAAKLGFDNNAGVQETRYHSGAAGNTMQFAGSGQLTVEGVKYRQAESVVVLSGAQPGSVTLAGISPMQVGQYHHRKKLPSFEISFERDMGKCVEVETGFVNAGVKYQAISSSTLNNIAYGQTSYMQAEAVHQMKEQRMDKREFSQELHHDFMATMMQQHQVAQPLQQGQQLLVVLHEPKDAAAVARAIKHDAQARQERSLQEFISIGDVSDAAAWQSLTGSGVTDYLSSLPLPLHQLLKYAPPEGKREEQTIVAINPNVLPITTITQVPQAQTVVVHQATILNPPPPPNSNANISHANTSRANISQANVSQDNMSQANMSQDNISQANISQANISQDNMSQEHISLDNIPEADTPSVTKKKRKKKSGGSKNIDGSKLGEIRLTTALDGSILYCCPECHMAYPDRDMLDQHLSGHTRERRYICEICNAALKRKDHLTRHRQSHDPARPHVCSVCLKAFKRKEQLTLHFVIHSGDKRHICNECDKAFYRKDHLRKHTRAHIARRVKAEMSQQGAPPAAAEPEPAPS